MKLTRQQFYDECWSTSGAAVQRKYNLKPSHFKEIATALNIPTPTSEYWRAINFGKGEAIKPELPPYPEKEEFDTDDYLRLASRSRKSSTPKAPETAYPTLVTEHSESKPDSVHSAFSTPEREALVDRFHAASTDSSFPAPESSPFIVPEVLAPKDELILDTLIRFKEEDFRKEHGWNTKNPYEGKARKWLNIEVSRELRDRALRIYTAVLNAAKHLGYQFVLEAKDYVHYRSCSTIIVVKDIEFPIRLFETSNRVVIDDGRWSRTDLRHNGRLRFEIGEYSFEKKYVQDTDYSRLEDKIEQLFQKLEQLADKEIESRRLRELAEERRRLEAERKRLEEEERLRVEREKEIERQRLENLRKEERQKLQLLLFQSQRLQVAKSLRQYIAALEGQHTTDESHITPDSSSQLQWMHDKLDFIDPFINKDDPILTLNDLAEVLTPIPSAPELTTSTSPQPSVSPISSTSLSPELEPNFWQKKYLYDKYNKR